MKLSSSKLIALQLSAFLLLTPQTPAADLNAESLPDVILVDFASSYCPPCRQMVPLLQNMEKSGFPVRKIDASQNPRLTQQFNVQLLPTLIVMVEGKEVRRFEGFTDENTLRQAMNDAARKLHTDRQQARSSEPAPDSRTAATDPNPDPGLAAESTETRAGLAGFFDRFKSPKNPQAQTLDDAEVRAQSPEESATSVEHTSIPHRATVRVRLMDGKMRDVGTGTVIHSIAGQSTILTCAHIFKEAAADAVVEVDIFQGDKVLKYPATVLGGDHNADVALIQIKNTTKLPAAAVAFDRTTLQPRESLFSIGCSNGDPPTRLKMNVVEVNRFEGPATILCTNAPTQGRSGGGLFDSQNRLVGVCSAADYKAGEGLYCGLPPLQQLMKQLNLTSLMQKTAENFSGAVAQADTTTESESPFPTDDGVFDALFGQASVADSSSGTTRPMPQTVSAPNAIQTGLSDPFAPATTLTRTAGTEITVIIKDPTAPNGQKVVVIPKASPWLLTLLTGETSATATAPANNTLPTSQRRTVEQPEFNSPAPFFQ